MLAKWFGTNESSKKKKHPTSKKLNAFEDYLHKHPINNADKLLQGMLISTDEASRESLRAYLNTLRQSNKLSVNFIKRNLMDPKKGAITKFEKGDRDVIKANLAAVYNKYAKDHSIEKKYFKQKRGSKKYQQAIRLDTLNTQLERACVQLDKLDSDKEIEEQQKAFMNHAHKVNKVGSVALKNDDEINANDGLAISNPNDKLSPALAASKFTERRLSHAELADYITKYGAPSDQENQIGLTKNQEALRKYLAGLNENDRKLFLDYITSDELKNVDAFYENADAIQAMSDDLGWLLEPLITNIFPKTSKSKKLDNGLNKILNDVRNKNEAFKNLPSKDRFSIRLAYFYNKYRGQKNVTSNSKIIDMYNTLMNDIHKDHPDDILDVIASVNTNERNNGIGDRVAQALQKPPKEFYNEISDILNVAEASNKIDEDIFLKNIKQQKSKQNDNEPIKIEIVDDKHNDKIIASNATSIIIGDENINDELLKHKQEYANSNLNVLIDGVKNGHLDPNGLVNGVMALKANINDIDQRLKEHQNKSLKKKIKKDDAGDRIDHSLNHNAIKPNAKERSVSPRPPMSNDDDMHAKDAIWDDESYKRPTRKKDGKLAPDRSLDNQSNSSVFPKININISMPKKLKSIFGVDNNKNKKKSSRIESNRKRSLSNVSSVPSMFANNEDEYDDFNENMNSPIIIINPNYHPKISIDDEDEPQLIKQIKQNKQINQIRDDDAYKNPAASNYSARLAKFYDQYNSYESDNPANENDIVEAYNKLIEGIAKDSGEAGISDLKITPDDELRNRDAVLSALKADPESFYRSMSDLFSIVDNKKGTINKDDFVQISKMYEKHKENEFKKRHKLDEPFKEAINQLYVTYENSKDIFDNLPVKYKNDREVTQEDVAKTLKELSMPNKLADEHPSTFYDDLECQIDARKDLFINEDPFREVINEVFEIYKDPQDIFDNLPLKYKVDSGVTPDEVENAVKEFNSDGKFAAKLGSFYDELDYQISVRAKGGNHLVLNNPAEVQMVLSETEILSLTDLHEEVSKPLPGKLRNGRFVMVKDKVSQEPPSQFLDDNKKAPLQVEERLYILHYSQDGRYVKKLPFSIKDPKRSLTKDELIERSPVDAQTFNEMTSEPGMLKNWKEAGWTDVSVLNHKFGMTANVHPDEVFDFRPNAIHKSVSKKNLNLQGKFFWVGNSKGQKALIKYKSHFKHGIAYKIVLTPGQYASFKKSRPDIARDVDCVFNIKAPMQKRKAAEARLKYTTKEWFHDQAADPTKFSSNGFCEYEDEIEELINDNDVDNSTTPKGPTLDDDQIQVINETDDGFKNKTQTDNNISIWDDDKERERKRKRKKLVCPDSDWSDISFEDSEQDMAQIAEHAEDFTFNKKVRDEMYKKTQDFQAKLDSQDDECGLKVIAESKASEHCKVKDYRFKCNGNVIDVKFKTPIEIDGVKGFFIVDHKGNQYISPAKELLKAMEKNLAAARKNGDVSNNAVSALAKLGASYVQNNTRLKYIDVNDSLKNINEKSDDDDKSSKSNLKVDDDINFWFQNSYDNALRENGTNVVHVEDEDHPSKVNPSVHNNTSRFNYQLKQTEGGNGKTYGDVNTTKGGPDDDFIGDGYTPTGYDEYHEYRLPTQQMTPL